MENNFKNEMKKLCDMQIELWNGIRNDLEVINNHTDEEFIEIFHKHLRETHHDAVLQLIKVKIEVNKIEGGAKCRK